MEIITKNLCPCLDCKIGTITYRQQINICRKNCFIYQKWIKQQKEYLNQPHWIWNCDTIKDLEQRYIIVNDK